ncbi:hypothetical protein [Amphritea sp.]|uniref:hypothetical protein n=1 Tax=Amphritea sp. TaxID=1872502 RepID=UPI003A8E323C
MERNRVFALLLPLILLGAASASYAEDSGALHCSEGEVPAYVITYDHYVTRLIDEQPDKIGHQVVTATADTRYYEETGEMLPADARQRGETTYTPYQKTRWDTLDAVYTYVSVGNVARVRSHPLLEKNTIPYDVLSQKDTLRTVADFPCNWYEEDIAEIQTTQRCDAVFYGWITPLYSRKVAEGRDILFSEASDISQRCVNKASLYVPKDKPWKFSD